MTTNGSNSTRAVLRAVTLACGLFLVGCGSADESVEAQPLVLPDGWFEMSGYGTVLHVEGDEITPHFVTPSTCTVGESFDNTLVVDHTETEDGVVVVDLVGPTTDYRLLPLVGPPRCEADVADTLTALDEAFTRHYPFFDQRGIDWPERFEAIQAAVSAGHDLEPTLASFLQTLGDGHTTLDGQDIEPDLGRFGLAGASDSQDLAALIDREVASTLGRLTEPQIDETGTVVWGGLDAHTGYLLMSSFVDLGQGGEDAWADVTSLRSALELAVADLDSRFDSLVIDMRFNPGGHEDLAVLAAGYFAQRPGPAYQKWAYASPDPVPQLIQVDRAGVFFDGDIVVMTSPLTASAAEVFLLAVTATSDARLVGSSSFGEFSDAIDWLLPDGTALTMSMEVYTDLDGNCFEAVGVPVDVSATLSSSIDESLGLLRRLHQAGAE